MGVDWRRRILTLVVGAPAALRLLLSDTGMPLLVMAICALCLLEFESNLCAQLTPRRREKSSARRVLVVASGVLVCLSAWGGDKNVHDATTALAMLAVITFHLLAVDSVDQHAMTALLLDVFALVFIAGGLSHAILLRYAHETYGVGLQLLGLVGAWVCDSAALVTGAFFGRAKLAPAISPGKTVVGALAGVASSVATVMAFHALPRVSSAFENLLPPSAVLTQVTLGVALGVLCVLGDLTESFVKRVAGVKDSGAFFPGHGGCLDRMDSVLLAAPFLYFYCRLAL